MPFLLTGSTSCGAAPESTASERGVAGNRVHHGDLLDRETGDDLDLVLVNDQHLFDAHAPLELLAVLGLQGEHHAFLDLDWMVERPDARDHRLVVLRKSEAVPPKIGCSLIFLRVTPGFLGG